MLGDWMSTLETQRQIRIDRGDKPAEVDREIAQLGLSGAMEFLLDQGIETKPLMRLLSELMALSAGAMPSDMLAPTVTRHRRPVAPVVETIKGRLAAIMEFRQQAGLSRKLAGKWVVQHASSNMKRKLGLASGATVDSWLVKWGGQQGGMSGSGREGYLRMRDILKDKKPPEAQLRKIIEKLEQSLPS